MPRWNVHLLSAAFEFEKSGKLSATSAPDVELERGFERLGSAMAVRETIR